MSRSPNTNDAGAAALPNVFAAPARAPTPARHGVFDDRAACIGEQLDGIHSIPVRVTPAARRVAWAIAGVATLVIAISLTADRQRAESDPVVPRPRTSEPAVTRPSTSRSARRARAPRRRQQRSHVARPRSKPAPTASKAPLTVRPARRPTRPVPPALFSAPKPVPSGSPPEFL